MEKADKLIGIPVNLIYRSTGQPRQDFDDKKLRELGRSLKSKGQQQPITVIHHPKMRGRYMIIDGERRWRAAQLVGIKTIECIVRQGQFDEYDASFIANLHRENLNPIEEALSFRKQISERGRSFQEVAELAGCSLATIAQRLALLRLDPGVQTMVRNGTLPVSKALHIGKIAPKDKQYEMARSLVSGMPMHSFRSKKGTFAGRGERSDPNPQRQLSLVFGLASRFRNHEASIRAFMKLPLKRQLIFWSVAASAAKIDINNLPTELEGLSKLAQELVEFVKVLSAAHMARSRDRKDFRPRQKGVEALSEMDVLTTKRILPTTFAAAQGILSILFRNPGPQRVSLSSSNLAETLSMGNHPDKAVEQAIGALRLARRFWDESPSENGANSAKNGFIGYIRTTLRDGFGNPKSFKRFCEIATSEDKSRDPISLKPAWKEE